MWRIVTLQGINAMWFLPCFLAVELIFIAANRAKHAAVYNVLIALAGMLAVCFPVLREAAPGLQRIVIGCAFMSLGFLGAKIYTSSFRLPLWLGCVALQFALAIPNDRVDMAYGIYGNPVLYYANGLLGTFAAIQAFACLAKSRLGSLIVWLGENSMIVLCTSSLVIEILRLLDYKLTDSVLPSLGTAEGIVLCALAMLIEIPIIIFCNRYLYDLLGKKNPHSLRNHCSNKESENT